jgi:4-hydroxy-tetrahydrodipicolinate synthase
MTRFTGVHAFCVTPTADDGERIDEDRLRRYVDHQIDAGVHGLTFFGSTGGVGLYSEEERRLVARVAVEQARGRVPVVIGTGSLTTSETVRLSRYAEEIGAAGVLVVPISYWKPTADELVAHYEAVARAIAIPLVIYNNPWTTGVDITPDLLARLARTENIYHVKESSGDMSRATIIRTLTGDRMIVWNGWDVAAPQAFIAGALGWGAGTASMIPRRCVELYAAAVEKRDMTLTQELFRPMLPLTELMTQRGYIRVAHTALDLMGRSMGNPRRPIRPLDAGDRARLGAILRDLGERVTA